MLEFFFNPLDKSILKSKSEFSDLIIKNIKKFPDLNEVEAVLIGIDEQADVIRKSLYQLEKGIENLNITDLGNLIYKTQKEKKEGLKVLIKICLEQNLKIILLGNTLGLESIIANSIVYKNIICSSVSPVLKSNSGLINSLITNKKFLFGNVIGLQNYLNSNDEISHYSENFIEYLRLGDFRSNFSISEPLLRQSDVVEFDMNSVKYSEFQSNYSQLPNGFYNHEICALSKYAGLSNKAFIYTFTNFDLTNTHHSNANLMAQMIWLILDGIANRFNDNPSLNNRNFVVYKCQTLYEQEIVFVKSLQTERLWMLIEMKKNKLPIFIGCTQEEFNLAQNGEIPEKWYLATKNI